MRTTRTGGTDRRKAAMVAAAIVLVTGACGTAPPNSGPAPAVSPPASASPSHSPAAETPAAGTPAATVKSGPPAGYSPPAENGRSLGYPFTLQVGETVTIDGEDLAVTYTRLVEDSRCAEGVQCVWAGNGRIVLTLAKAGSEPVELELNTTLEPTTGRYLAYTFGLDHLGRENPPLATIALNRA